MDKVKASASPYDAHSDHEASKALGEWCMTSLDFLRDQLDWLSRCFDRVRAADRAPQINHPGTGQTHNDTDVFNRNPSNKPQTPPTKHFMPTVLIFAHTSGVLIRSQESAVGLWSVFSCPQSDVFNVQIYVLSPAVYVSHHDDGS